jgi:hypothetical protein
VLCRTINLRVDLVNFEKGRPLFQKGPVPRRVLVPFHHHWLWVVPFESGSGPFSFRNPLTYPRVAPHELHAFREMPGGSHGRQIPSRSSLDAHFRLMRCADRHCLLEFTLGDYLLWQIAGGSSMSDARTLLRKKMHEKLAELKSSAIAELEHRGYEVRGKTKSKIRQILKRHPTKPPLIA